MIRIPALPDSVRKQIRGLLGNTVGETDIIKVLAIAGFCFAHYMIVRDFDVNKHFGFTDYCIGLGTLIGVMAAAFRLRGDHDTPDSQGKT
jgi:hypothetical protein